MMNEAILNFPHNKNLLIAQEASLVDNSIEISNISFTQKDLIETNNLVSLINFFGCFLID